MSRADDDRKILHELSFREVDIADAATRQAYERCADWLTMKQTKAEQFPGGNLEHAKGRAAAYQNAAQEFYGWLNAYGGEEDDE